MTGAAANLLDGQVAIVTGARRASASPLPRGFSRYGASVLIADVDEAQAQAAARSLKAGERAVAQRCDVTKAADHDALVKACLDELRPARHPRQQRRHHAGRVHVKMSEADFRRRDRRQPEGRVARHARGCAAVSRAAQRLDHQHVVALGKDRQPGPNQLQRREGGPDRADQGCGQGARSVRRAGQRGHARAHQDRDDAGDEAGDLSRPRKREVPLQRAGTRKRSPAPWSSWLRRWRPTSTVRSSK